MRKRSKRGLPEHLPDLTQGRTPHAGSVVIQSLPRTNDIISRPQGIDAEYHGVYTIRGAKIRPNAFVEAWLYDPKMDQHYTSVVYRST